MSSAQAKSEGGESQEDSGSQNSSFVDESRLVLLSKFFIQPKYKSLLFIAET